MRSFSRFAAGALIALALGAVSCHSNAHGYQDLPHVIRIESRPAGAEMTVQKNKMFFTLPSDVEMGLSGSDVITVRKNGYHTYRGPIGELPKSGQNTFLVVLRPVE